MGVLLEEEVRHPRRRMELARRRDPAIRPRRVGLARDAVQRRAGARQIAVGGMVDQMAAVAAHSVDELAADVLHLGLGRPHLGGVAADAAGLGQPRREDRSVQVLLRLPSPLRFPLLLLFLRDRAVPDAGEVGRAVETVVAGRAAVRAVRMDGGVGDEQVEARMAAERLLPLLALEARPAGRDVTGQAAVDPLHGREVDVVVEAGEHHLLDLEIGLDEVHDRRVEDEERESLRQALVALLEGADRGPQALQLLLRLIDTRTSLGQLVGDLVALPDELLDAALGLHPLVDQPLDLGLLGRSVAFLQRLAVLPARRVEQRLQATGARVLAVDLLVECDEARLELPDLRSATLDLGTRLLDGRLRPGDLVGVEPLPFGRHFGLDRRALAVPELGLQALPRLGVVREHHPHGDHEQRERAPREHHVGAPEAVMAVGAFFRRRRHR